MEQSKAITEALDPAIPVATLPLDSSIRVPTVPFLSLLSWVFLALATQRTLIDTLSFRLLPLNKGQVTKLKSFCGKRKGAFPFCLPSSRQWSNTEEQLANGSTLPTQASPQRSHWKQVHLESKTTTCFSLHPPGEGRHVSRAFLITFFFTAPLPRHFPSQ